MFRSNLSTRRWLFPLASAFVLTLLPGMARPQTSPPPSAQPSPPPAAQPANSGPTFGGEIRLRAEGFDNILDLDKQQDDSYQYFRMRYRLWTEVKPRDGLRLYFRLGGESKWGVFEKDRPAGSAVSEQAGIRDPESRVGLDNAWAEVRLPWAKGLSLKFGRMDLNYGEGFLIADGTPADGSSSAFFDGLSLSLKGEKRQTDLFAMKIQDEGLGTAARDENFFGLYTHRGSLDAYVLHRTKWGTTVNGASGSREGILHPRQYTTCVGMRFTRLPESGLQLALEGAGQAGRYFWEPASRCRSDLLGKAGSWVIPPERPYRAAFGGIAHGGWVGVSPRKPGVDLGGVLLSGDDPCSTTYEGWDGFYSEWPKYSDLLVYTLYDNTTRIRPDDPGTWTNLAAGWIEARIKPTSISKVALKVTRLYAPELTVTSAGGRDRGLLTTGQCGFTFHPNLDAQILGEYFVPGSFYDRMVDGKVHQADTAWYGRAQITARF